MIIKSKEEHNHLYKLEVYGNEQEELIRTGNDILKLLGEKIEIEYNYKMEIIDGMNYSSIIKIDN